MLPDLLVLHRFLKESLLPESTELSVLRFRAEARAAEQESFDSFINFMKGALGDCENMFKHRRQPSRSIAVLYDDVGNIALRNL